MIKLGKLTDYAVVLMAQLLKEGQAVPRSAGYLSDKTGIPEPTVAKILKLLVKEKIIESARGAAGGYRLAKAGTEITVADIITALDGPISIVSCAEGSDEPCKSEAHCPVRGNWDHVNTLIRQALESVKLSDMTGVSCRRTYNFVQVREAHVGHE